MFPENSEQLPEMRGSCSVSPVPPDDGVLSKKSARPAESMAPITGEWELPPVWLTVTLPVANSGL